MLDLISIFSQTRKNYLHDDLNILRNWAEYDDNREKMKYLMFELEVEEAPGQYVKFFKAIKIVRITRLPKSAKQSEKFMDMHADILKGVWERNIKLVTIIANIIKPDPVGLVFCYGVQGVATSEEEAKNKADKDYFALTGSLTGTYRVLEYNLLTYRELEWLREKMFSMKNLTVLRGLPKPREGGVDAGNSGIGGKNLNQGSEDTSEEFIAGMTEHEYVVEIMSTPVKEEHLQKWLQQTAQQMTMWNKQLTGTSSINFSLSIPMMYMANLGASEGWSHSYSNADSFSSSHSDSFSTSFSSSIGESMSQSVGETLGKSIGHSYTESYGDSHSINVGESYGENVGINHSSNVGSSLSNTWGHSTGESAGSNIGHSVNSSESSSVSHTSSDGTNQSTSTTHSSSETQSISESQSRGTSSSVSRGTSNTHTTGSSSSTSHGTSHSTSSGHSSTHGSSTGSNQSSSTSNSNSSTSGSSSSSTSGSSHTNGTSASATVGGSVGIGGTNVSASASAGVNSSNTSSQSSTNTNSSSNTNTSGTGTSSGTSAGTSNSSSSTSSSTSGSSTTHTSGTSVSDSKTTSTTNTTGTSQSYSISQGNSYSTSISNGYSNGVSHTDSDGTSQSWANGVGDSWGASYSASQSANESYSTSGSTGESWGSSNGANWSNSSGESWGTSRSQSYGASETDSYSQSSSQSVGKSWSNSEGVSAGTSDSTSKGLSNSVGLGTTGTMTSGTTSTMGLGPAISIGKSYQWTDQEVQNILTLLEFQNMRLMKALRGNGAFYTDAYIATENEDALSAASMLAKTAWHNENAMICPLQVLDLSIEEQAHLLYHFSAFSPDVSRVNLDNLMSSYKYSTILLPEEATAYCHIPRISEGGVYSDAENIPTFSVPSQLKGDIYLGHVLSSERWTPESGNETPFEYRLDESELMHGIIAGESRSGKTVAALRFVSELTKIKRKTGKRLRIIAMDPKQDWRSLGKIVEPERFHFYSLGNPDFLPISLNILKVPHNVNPQVYIDGIIEIYCRAYGLMERGKSLLAETIYELMDEAGVFEDSPDWRSFVPERSANVTFCKVYERMMKHKIELEDPVKSGKGRMGMEARDSYTRLLDRLQIFGRKFSIESRLFGQEDGMGIDELIGQDDVVVLESYGLESSFKNFVFGCITSGFFKYAQGHEGGFLADDQYETVLVIEEANEILSGSDTAARAATGMSLGGQSEFEKILDQAAGLGLFIFSITQKPADMPSSVIANSGIVFAGKLSREEDTKVIIRKIGREERMDNRDVLKWFPRSPIGWFVCRSSRNFNFLQTEPILVHVDPISIEKPTNNDITTILNKKRALKLLEDDKKTETQSKVDKLIEKITEK